MYDAFINFVDKPGGTVAYLANFSNPLFLARFGLLHYQIICGDFIIVSNDVQIIVC